MNLMGYSVKKRYLLAGLVVAVVLVKCSTSHDEQQYADTYQDAPAAPQIASTQGQSTSATPSQSVNINQAPAQNSNDSFFQNLMMWHWMSGGGGRDVHHYHDAPAARSYYTPAAARNIRTTTNNKTVVNNYHSPAPASTPKATTYTPPYKAPVATNYRVSAPVASNMKTKSWSTGSAKGWGSTSSYKSGSSGFRSSRSGRR